MSIIEVQATRSQDSQAVPRGRGRFEDKNPGYKSQIPFYVGFTISALLLYLKSSLVPWAEAHAGQQELGQSHDAPTQAPSVQDILTADLQGICLPDPLDLFQQPQLPKPLRHPTVHATDLFNLNLYANAYQTDAANIRFQPLPENPMQRFGEVVNFPVLPTNNNVMKTGGGGTDAGNNSGMETGGNSTPPPKSKNRAPKVSGPVYLSDQFVCTMVAVAIADLLRNATDADAGDTLSVKDVKVNGVLLEQVNGIYSYHGEHLGPITINYLVTDGLLSVAETATINFLEKPPIVGTSGDDILLGTACDDNISGGAGNDRVDGNGGDDVIYGECGNDQIAGGDGNDVIFGGDGNDIIFGGSGNDVLSGGNGDDRLFGDAGNDILQGGAGNDTLFGGDGNDVLEGGSGRDWLYDGLGSDRVDGGTGNDTVFAAADAANDMFNGNTGIDKLSYAESKSDLVFNLSLGVVTGADVGTDQVANFEIFEGGAGNDVFLAILHPATLPANSDQGHTYFGGAGQDALDYCLAQQSMTVDLNHGTVQGAESGTDYFENMESFVTGSGDDTFIAAGYGSPLYMNIFDEQNVPEAGDNCAENASSVDTLNPLVLTEEHAADAPPVVAGDQNFSGGAGIDTLDYSGATHDLSINVAQGVATGQDIGTDTFQGIEHFIGGAGNDTFIVGKGDITLDGRGGNDMFQFLVDTAVVAERPSQYHIQGFEAGDWVRISKYDIFDKVDDTVESSFHDIYGDAQGKTDGQTDQDLVAPIRIRYEVSDDLQNTFVNADFDQDGTYEFNIQIDGVHHLMIVNNHMG